MHLFRPQVLICLANLAHIDASGQLLQLFPVATQAYQDRSSSFLPRLPVAMLESSKSRKRDLPDVKAAH